jgi:hypothetical protein
VPFHQFEITGQLALWRIATTVFLTKSVFFYDKNRFQFSSEWLGHALNLSWLIVGTNLKRVVVAEIGNERAKGGDIGRVSYGTLLTDVLDRTVLLRNRHRWSCVCRPKASRVTDSD